jgi:hypothetical protein
MPETVIEVVEVNNTLPLKHQFGKLLVATIAAFLATKLAEKSYDVALDKWTNRQLEIPAPTGS